MNIKEIINKYPVTNDEWGYRCMPPDIGGYDGGGLNTYLYNVLYGIKNVGSYKNFKYYMGVSEFFVRYSKNDDITGGNSDPWHRSFKVYKVNRAMVRDCDGYICDTISVDGSGKPIVYIMSTSVEGKIVYCVDRINI